MQRKGDEMFRREAQRWWHPEAVLGRFALTISWLYTGGRFPSSRFRMASAFVVVTAVLSWHNFKLKQKGMLTAKPYRCDRDDNYSECFNMQLTSAGPPFLFQSPNKGAPPTPPLPLLFPPKALTASRSNQIPATVQCRGPISDNAIAACLSGCTYYVC